MMKNYLKTATTIAIVITLLTMPAICQTAMTDEGRQQIVNAFLQNVIGLETKNYEMKLVSEMNTPEREAALLYNLNSDDGKLEIILNFRNDEIVSCSINQIKGSITIANPDKNTLSATQELLDNYQAYSNASYIQPLKENIQAISELKNTTITTQYAKLSISVQDSEYQCFDWMNAPNGIHNMYNRLSLVFQNGSLKSFTDAWNQYPFGDYKEVLSKEQAIATAKANLANYSYEFGNETISNLQLNEKTDWMIANLTMQPRNNVLYPNWEIVLPLDKVYPGFTYGFRVMIWADTGEVISARATGSLGFPADVGNNNLATPTPVITDQSADNTVYIVSGAVVAVIIVAAIALIKKASFKK
jgi:hypothetical protein